MVTSAILGSQSQVSVHVTGSTDVTMEIAFGEVEWIRLKGSTLEQYLQVTFWKRLPQRLNSLYCVSIRVVFV